MLEWNKIPDYVARWWNERKKKMVLFAWGWNEQRVRHCRRRSPDDRNWLNSKPRQSHEIVMVD